MISTCPFLKKNNIYQITQSLKFLQKMIFSPIKIITPKPYILSQFRYLSKTNFTPKETIFAFKPVERL